jgi:hypothetical protein
LVVCQQRLHDLIVQKLRELAVFDVLVDAKRRAHVRWRLNYERTFHVGLWDPIDELLGVRLRVAHSEHRLRRDQTDNLHKRLRSFRLGPLEIENAQAGMVPNEQGQLDESRVTTLRPTDVEKLEALGLLQGDQDRRTQWPEMGLLAASQPQCSQENCHFEGVCQRRNQRGVVMRKTAAY